MSTIFFSSSLLTPADNALVYASISASTYSQTLIFACESVSGKISTSTFEPNSMFP